MPYYYKGFDHTNENDEENDVVSLTSNESEKIHIVSVIITAVVNAGKINGYIEREKIIDEISTDGMNIQNFIEIPIEHDLPIGQTFKLTLMNKVSGTNATIRGFIKYIIK